MASEVSLSLTLMNVHWDWIQRETWCMGSFTGVDFNLTLCRLQSRLQHMYNARPYARVDLKGSLTRDFRLQTFSWVSYPYRTPEYPIGTFSLLRKSSDIFESDDGQFPVSTTPTPAINHKNAVLRQKVFHFYLRCCWVAVYTHSNYQCTANSHHAECYFLCLQNT